MDETMVDLEQRVLRRDALWIRVEMSSTPESRWRGRDADGRRPSQADAAPWWRGGDSRNGETREISTKHACAKKAMDVVNFCIPRRQRDARVETITPRVHRRTDHGVLWVTDVVIRTPARPEVAAVLLRTVLHRIPDHGPSAADGECDVLSVRATYDVHKSERPTFFAFLEKHCSVYVAFVNGAAGRHHTTERVSRPDGGGGGKKKWQVSLPVGSVPTQYAAYRMMTHFGEVFDVHPLAHSRMPDGGEYLSVKVRFMRPSSAARAHDALTEFGSAPCSEEHVEDGARDARAEPEPAAVQTERCERGAFAAAATRSANDPDMAARAPRGDASTQTDTNGHTAAAAAVTASQILAEAQRMSAAVIHDRVLAGRAYEDLLQVVASLARCPLSGELMRVPVTANDGVTYDLYSLNQWIGAHGPYSPATGAFLTAVTPNRQAVYIVREVYRRISFAGLAKATDRSPAARVRGTSGAVP